MPRPQVELIISAVQLVWYLIFYALIFFQEAENALDIKYRYIDCAPSCPPPPPSSHPPQLRAGHTVASCARAGSITTAFMLLSLNLLLKVWGTDTCLSVSDAFSDSFLSANIVAIVFDEIMLAIGLAVELQTFEPENEYAALLWGFVPYLFAFVPSFFVWGNAQSLHGILVLMSTLVVWGIYGVVAIRYRASTESKATGYNLLVRRRPPARAPRTRPHGPAPTSPPLPRPARRTS